jgi:hypothetical protein
MLCHDIVDQLIELVVDSLQDGEEDEQSPMKRISTFDGVRFSTKI